MALFQNQSVHHKSGRNSVAECQLPKLNVVGSIPIARSIFYPQFSPIKSTLDPLNTAG